MDARQLKTCAARLAALALALIAPVAQADQLKLPETPDQYRKLLDESSKTENEGKSGQVLRIVPIKVTVKGQETVPNPTVTEVVGGTPGVQPVPLLGKNVKSEKAKERDTSRTRYQVAVRWADGSIGVFEQDDVGNLREGDPVVVHGHTVARDPAR